jgi:hypothetical protein
MQLQDIILKAAASKGFLVLLDSRYGSSPELFEANILNSQKGKPQ